MPTFLVNRSNFLADRSNGSGRYNQFVARRKISMDEVLLAIEELESRYGVPSERRLEAIKGEPCASEDLMLWNELVWVRDRASARTA